MVNVTTENSQMVSLQTTLPRNFAGVVDGKSTFTETILRMKPYIVGLESGSITPQKEITINPLALTEEVRTNLMGIESALVDAFEEYYTPGYAERLEALETPVVE